MKTIINPLEIHITHNVTLLHTLLTSNKMRLIWEQEEEYQVGNQVLSLTHTICLNQLTNGLARYHVIANKLLGHGTFGNVFEIAYSFKFHDNGEINIIGTMPLVAKMQYSKSSKDLNRFICKIQQEYQASRLTKHIFPEEPIFSEDKLKACLITQRMPGRDLQCFIDSRLKKQQAEKKDPWGWKFKFALTIKILTAFAKQIRDKNISHLDIKPANIMIDVNQDLKNNIIESIEINFIDFAFSKKFGEKITGIRGTDLYMSPEMKANYHGVFFYDEKPDLFAIGIILQIIWGLYNIKNPELNFAARNLNKVYNSSNNGNDFSLDMFKSVCEIIWYMMDPNPSRRSSLKTVMIQFKNITKPFIKQIQPHLDKVSQTIKAEPELINQFNRRGLTLLHTSIERNLLKTAEFLIDNGADLDLLTYHDKLSPLDLAFSHAHYDMATLLIVEGAGIPSATNGKTHFIHIAVQANQLELVQCLIEADDSLIQTTDSEEQTPLMIAQKFGHVEIIQFLDANIPVMSDVEEEMTEGFNCCFPDIFRQRSTTEQRPSNQHCFWQFFRPNNQRQTTYDESENQRQLEYV